MAHGFQPYRSVLYMPGSNPRALEKARGLPADALIFDLEDAVAPREKPRARALAAEAVEAGGFGGRRVLIRVNGLETEWAEADIARACAAGAQAILVPKIETAEDVARAASRLDAHGAPPATRLWAMMETPRAMLNVAAIAGAHPRLEGMMLGTNDLANDLGALSGPGRMPLLTGLGLCLLAARAAGLVCIDGVYNAFRDPEGLRAECRQGREMGFDGKSLIHPDQIATANEVFAPTEAELAEARALVEAFEAAEARGEGIAVLEGRLVENLHAAAARRMIARAEAIAAIHGG